MSSYADIHIDGKRVFMFRNEASPEALALFRPEELKRTAHTAYFFPELQVAGFSIEFVTTARTAHIGRLSRAQELQGDTLLPLAQRA